MDIRSSLHNRMRSLKQNKDANIDYKKIPSHAIRAVAFSIQHSYRIARNHPFVTGLALFLLLLYSYLPSLFGFLISSSPVIICTTLLLGLLLSFGEPDLPEIDEEEMKMSHDVSSSLQQVCGVPDDLVCKKDEEELETASFAFHNREIEEEDATVYLHADEDMVHENQSSSLHTQGVPLSSRTILEENNHIVVGSAVMCNKGEIEEDTSMVSRMPFHGFPDVDDVQNEGSVISTTERSLESKKDVEPEDSTIINQVVDAATDISGLCSSMITAEVEEATPSPGSTNDWEKEGLQTERGEKSTERKDTKDQFFEKIYIHEEMLAEDASVGAESVPDLDLNAHEDTVYVKAESDGTPTGICYYSLLSTKKSVDGPDDSGSDAAESSSSDASMADIIPMLDELRPFLDADLSRPVHINIDSNDDDDDDEEEEDDDDGDDDDGGDKDASEESSSDAKSDSATEEHVAVDQPHPVAQKQKPTETEFVLSWTPDDEKNLMDLGLSEFERNQRLENMIARRRARKGLENSMSFHAAAADALNMNRIAPLDVHIPPVSIRRNNPFDNHYDSQELNGLPPVPGSAPSVFSRRRNPFEFPYWERNDSHNTTGDGLHPLEFVPEKVGSSSEGFEDFTFGPSSSGDNREEISDSNVAPHFPAARTESVTYSRYERQLSRLSDPRLSSIFEPEPISPMVQRSDLIPGERDLLQENHTFSTASHDEDVAVQPAKEERDTDFPSIKESLDILTSSELAQHGIVNELEPTFSDAPQSGVVEGESDKSDASTEKDDVIYANNHEVTIDPQSAKPYLSTDSSASLNAAPQGSDAQPEDIGLSDQDLNSADKAFGTAHRSIERSIPYDTENLSSDDAAWLREIAEMRKLDLSGNSQESQAQSNMHFTSISSIESESYEQIQINNDQKLDTPMPYLQALTAADNLTSCAPGHPYLPVDEPVLLPSYSCSESRIDILPPISEEIAADSDHEEHHGVLGIVVEKSLKLLSDDEIDPSLPEYPMLQVEPLTLPPHCTSTASPKKETVDGGSVNLSIDELGTSQFLDVQSYDEVTTTYNEVKGLDEGLLSELDVVGDFSVQNLNSSQLQCANKSISHSHLGDNGPSSVIFEEVRALCENQELSTDISQSNCHVSPLPENDISIGLPAKEYKGNDLRLLDSSVEHGDGETGNIEDISPVLQEPEASTGRNIILDSATDYCSLSQIGFHEIGLPSKELDAPEDGGHYEKMFSHSDMQEVEAESIDDIHHALKNFVGANQFLTEQPTDMQFISSPQDAETHNLECVDLAVEQESIASGSHIPIEDIGISCHNESRSSEVLCSAAKHQIEFTCDSALGKSEAETVPLLVLSHSSLNNVETSVEASCLSTKNVTSGSEVTECAQHEVEEKPPKDAVAALVVTADLDDSKLKYLEDVQLTVWQKEICSESTAGCLVLPEVEENSPEDLTLKQKDAYSEPVTMPADLPDDEGLSLKNKEFALFQQEKQTEKAAVHSQMHEVEAQSVDDLHAVFKQQGIESAYRIHSEPHEVEAHSAENLVGTKLNFSLGQEDDRSGIQTIECSEMHEIEAQSLEDIHMAFRRQTIETKPEIDLCEIETKSVDELLVEEVQNLGFAMNHSDMHSEELGDYSEIHEIEARSLDDLHAVFGKHSEKDCPAIDSELHGTEAPSRTILDKETTPVDCEVDRQKPAELLPPLSEMHEVEARSYDDLHIILQQQGIIVETVICSEPQKDEVRTGPKALGEETIDRDSTMEQERHLPTDHSLMHEAEAGSLDGSEIGFGQHSDKKTHEVQIQSAEDSMVTEIMNSDLLKNQNLLDTEETPVYGLYMSDEKLYTQSDMPEEGNLSSGSFVPPELPEIEAHSLDDLHLALSLKTTGLDTLEKEVNLSESQSSFHEIEAYSLDDLHLALGKHVTPLKTSLIQSDQNELENLPLGKGNTHSESPETQYDLHEIEVHCLDDLHLALGKQGMLSALTQGEHKVETQSLEKENARSGTSVACFDMPNIEVCSPGGVTLDSSLDQSDLQKVEIQSHEKERKLLESAAEHPELQETKAASIADKVC